MEISSSASSAALANLSGFQPQASRAEPERQLSQAQTQGNRETQTNPPVQERADAGRVQNEAEPNRPTVNAEGQRVGERINTTA